jgi:peptidoglycan/LPS O-acetylase OafA/YrhL
MEQAQATTPGRLGALDGWRTFSIALVIVCHLLIQSSIKVSLDTLGPAAAMIQHLGVTGVHVFFVISGFVICRGMLREEQRHGRVSLSAFYTRRLMRIMPPLLLYVGVIVLLAWLGVLDARHAQASRALTFTCNFSGAECGGYLGAHTWSLSYEEQFYLIAPPLFVMAAAGRKRGGAWMLIALVAAALSASFAGLAAAAEFISNFFFIMTGVACALREETVRKWLCRLPRGSFWILVVAFLLFERLAVTRLWLPAMALSAVVIAGMLMMTAFGLSPTRSWLSSRPMVSIGRISYSIYLWQQLATYAFPGATLVFYLVSIPTCIGLSYLSFALMERPLIAFGAKWSAKLIERRSRHSSPATAKPDA